MHCNNLYNNNPVKSFFSNLYSTYPMVVIKLVVKEPSENRRRRQLFPTPIRGFFLKKKESQVHYQTYDQSYRLQYVYNKHDSESMKNNLMKIKWKCKTDTNIRSSHTFNKHISFHIFHQNIYTTLKLASLASSQ